MKNIRLISIFITLLLLLTGIGFKFLHMQNSNLFFLLSFFVFSLFFLPVSIYNKYIKSAKTYAAKLKYISIYLSLTLIYLFFVIRFYHLIYSGYLFVFAVLFGIISGLCFYFDSVHSHS